MTTQNYFFIDRSSFVQLTGDVNYMDPKSVFNTIEHKELITVKYLSSLYLAVLKILNSNNHQSIDTLSGKQVCKLVPSISYGRCLYTLVQFINRSLIILNRCDRSFALNETNNNNALIRHCMRSSGKTDERHSDAKRGKGSPQ